jgi:hypothetical protein
MYVYDVQRFAAWRSCGNSEQFTVNLPLKPNRSTALEFKRVTPHDAKRLLPAGVLLSVVCGLSI